MLDGRICELRSVVGMMDGRYDMEDIRDILQNRITVFETMQEKGNLGGAQ